jgi:hypothetical protein
VESMLDASYLLTLRRRSPTIDDDDERLGET